MNKLKTIIIALRFKLYRLWWRFKFQFFREKIPQNSDDKIYLNLGCGVNTSSEFINIDAFPFRRTHWVSDIQNLSMFPNNSVDMIYASHVIEHIPRGNLKKTLSEWHRVLKIGGVLRFGVPDFDKLIDFYNMSGKETGSIIDQLFGQDTDYGRHCTLWNFKCAKEILNCVGFSGEPRFWDAKTTEHHSFHDKSNRSISLNLEVTKLE